MRLLSCLSVLAVVATGCARPPMTRFDHESIHLEVGGTVRAVSTASARGPLDGALAMAPGAATYDVPVHLAAGLGKMEAVQIHLETRIVETTQRDLSVLGVELFTPDGQAVLPTDVENTTPSAPTLSLGVGFGTTLGGGGGGGNSHPPGCKCPACQGGGNGTGVGVGVGVPIVTTGDNRVTSMRTTFNLPGPVSMLNDVHVAILVRVLEQGDDNILAQPLLLPITVAKKDDAAEAAQVQLRQAQTRVLIRDGQTVALGGLVETTPPPTADKVPILSKVPYLNRLFRSTSEKVKKRELVIFITPRVIIAEEAD